MTTRETAGSINQTKGYNLPDDTSSFLVYKPVQIDRTSSLLNLISLYRAFTEALTVKMDKDTALKLKERVEADSELLGLSAKTEGTGAGYRFELEGIAYEVVFI